MASVMSSKTTSTAMPTCIAARVRLDVHQVGRHARALFQVHHCHHEGRVVAESRRGRAVHDGEGVQRALAAALHPRCVAREAAWGKCRAGKNRPASSRCRSEARARAPWSFPSKSRTPAGGRGTGFVYACCVIVLSVASFCDSLRRVSVRCEHHRARRRERAARAVDQRYPAVRDLSLAALPAAVAAPPR